MKQLAFILALILVSTTIALQPSVQQHLANEGVMDKLKKSHFGKAIIKMLEVTTSVKADFGPLFDALDTLKSSLLEKKETEINDFQSD
jgi:Tfp pilus assembly major pilin PilA